MGGYYSQRLLLVGLVFLLVVLGLAVGHNLGMEYLEERPRTFLESVEFVTQTMTTVGYGQDAPWEQPAMQILVIITQFAGILIVVTAIPLVLSPWLQERLRRQPPIKYDGPNRHVLIGYYNDALLSLLNTLERRNLPYLLVEPDENLATQLFREERNVLWGDPEKLAVLREANAVEASHFVLAGRDEQNVTASLALQELIETAEVNPPPERIAIARRLEHTTHLRQAGIDKIVYPGEIVGRWLVDRLFTRTGMNLDFGCELPEDFQIYEFPLIGDHQLIGRRLRDSSLREKLATNLIGVRRQNQFIASPDESFLFHKNDVLLLADKQDELDKLSSYFAGNNLESGEQHAVIIGFGSEGCAAKQRLEKEKVEVTVIDDILAEEVDIVGDGSSKEVLKKAGVETADIVIITVSADDTAIMITLLVRELNKKANLLVQSHQNETIESFYRAGATFVEGLPRVTSRILAGYVVGEHMLDFELEVQVKPVTAGQLAGKSAMDEQLRRRYNIIVLGVIRSEELIIPFFGEQEFEKGDILLISGSRTDMEKFINKYSLTPVTSS